MKNTINFVYQKRHDTELAKNRLPLKAQSLSYIYRHSLYNANLTWNF